ncbi:NF-X1-type zinc finger protein NFXL1 [Tanacetum coccineum]
MSRERIGNGNDRRQPRNYRRQEWIPRGSTPSIPPPPLDTTNININTPFASNTNLDANHHHPPNNRSHNVSKSHFIPSTRGRGSGVVNHQHQQNMNIVNANNSNRIKGESLLPHLVQEIQDKLLKGSIECMICYDMVRRTASIWSCSSCYSIFHLHCIKKWARAPTSIDLSAQKNQRFNWRCPGCQSVQLTSSKDICYLCFCRNRQDPPSDLYLTPHSCGEPCGRPLDKDHRVSNHDDDDRDDGRFRHRCVVQCYPSPCPPCKAFAPPRICPCVKKTIPTRCSDQKSLLTCGQHCGKPLKCLRHCCSKTCHVGPCDSCDVQIDASCFCKKKIEVVICGDMDVKGHANVENDGIFSCNSSCGKPLGCGNHVYKETCHPGVCGDCELLPGRITSCHCGKSSLQEERHSCLDPIPTCSKICDKILPCGLHRCKDKCHPGSCAPCRVMVTQKCHCGSTYRTAESFNTTTTMTDGADTAFKCDKPCGRKKNCGRHRCSDKCRHPGLGPTFVF